MRSTRTHRPAADRLERRGHAAEPAAGAEGGNLRRHLGRRGTFAGALKVAAEAPRGATLLAMLPDTGERYLSTPLFADIPADMTAEEQEIMHSTPMFRFDAPGPVPAPVSAAAGPPVEADAGAKAFVADILANEPVVMFALEWCEFCWAARRLFAAYKIPYRSVDLDSVEYQRDDLGGRVRPELLARTGSGTIPQIFIGGAALGGCSDLFDAARSGVLRERLDAAGVAFDAAANVDLPALLPNWVKRA